MSVRVRVAAAGTGALLLAVGLSWHPARATAANRAAFQAAARADGASVSVSDPAVFPLGLVPEGSGPTAAAHLDSLGSSTGYAACPYPGSTVAAAPATARGVAGTPVPPDFPFFVTSSNRSSETENAGTTAPGYSLHAHSTDTATTATAAAGITSGQATLGSSVADARTSLSPSGDVSASAASTAEEVEFAGVLRLGRIAAHADVVRRADGSLLRTSDLQVAETAVAGQRVSLTPGGLVVGGKATPLPQDPVRQILEQAGVDVVYLQPKNVPGGVVSAGLAVTLHVTDPNGAPATVTVVLGRASAIVAAAPTPSGSATTTVTSEAGPVASTSPPSPRGANAPAAAPAGGTRAVPALSSHPSVAAGAPVVAGAPGLLSARPVAASAAPDLEVGSLVYLLLALGGVAAGVGLTLIRIVGVRAR